jgi:hypothetical protein
VVAEGLELIQEPRQFEDAYDTTLRIDIDMHTIQWRPLVVFCESIADFMATGVSNTADK